MKNANDVISQEIMRQSVNGKFDLIIGAPGDLYIEIIGIINNRIGPIQ